MKKTTYTSLSQQHDDNARTNSNSTSHILNYAQAVSEPFDEQKYLNFFTSAYRINQNDVVFNSLGNKI